MSLDADTMVERRRMRRQLSLWRALAIAVAIVGVIGLGYALFLRTGGSTSGSHIARVTIDGVITGDRATLRLLDQVGRSNAAGVVIQIDSPGGTVPGSEALHDAIRELSGKKPVVAVVNTLAASGGYIAAMGADRIVARRTAIVGSIGVIFQVPNVTKLLDTIGVSVESVRSTPLKAAPSGVEPTSPEARAAIVALVNESYGWFRGMVTDRRQISGSELDRVADGRVFSGQQALSLKLIDQIGSEKDAIAWMETTRGIAKDLPVRDWRRRSTLERRLNVELGSALGWLGLNRTIDTIERAALRAEALALDGLLAVWQPASEN
jgi:protease-4